MSSTLDQRPAIDRRIAARRQTVREAGARRRLRWLLVLLGLAGGGALIAWLLYQSSFLAVSEITVGGQHRSAVDDIVAAGGLVEGMPTVNVPAEELEHALLADPWVAAADVAVRWPGTVEITVVEYVPAAWVRTGDDWLLVAAGGAVVETAGSIPDDAPQILLDVAPVAPGGVLEGRAVLGAIEFLNQLPAAQVVGASVSGEDTQLRAVVEGYVIELGYPIDLADKAAALVALLGQGAPVEGSIISLVSPDRPAVLAPTPPEAITDEGEAEDGAGADTGGDRGSADDT